MNTPTKKYGAILIDPPWHFRTFSGKQSIAHRCNEQHYKTMKLHELAALPINQLAAKNCALFMWVTTPHLEESFQLINIWGFNYKSTAFIWMKLAHNNLDLFDPPPARMSMGYWTRKQSEMCLFATKGRPKRLSKGVREVIQAPKRQHSRKPDEQYQRIEALVGGPYLEMFARQKWPGWDNWGNETDKFKVAAE